MSKCSITHASLFTNVLVLTNASSSYIQKYHTEYTVKISLLWVGVGTFMLNNEGADFS